MKPWVVPSSQEVCDLQGQGLDNNADSILDDLEEGDHGVREGAPTSMVSMETISRLVDGYESVGLEESTFLEVIGGLFSGLFLLLMIKK